MTPDNRLRASIATTALVGLVAVVCLSLFGRAELDLSDLYPFKAAACFAIVMRLAIGFLGDTHRFARFGPANQVTTARAVVVALVASLIGEPTRAVVAATAAAASLVVTLLDGLDGWLARRSRMASPFGARFDMEVDALLILALAILVWRYDKAGAWVVLSGLLRYLFVAAGWWWQWLRHPLPPSRRGKVICVVQIVGLTVAIAPIVTPSVSVLLAGAALLALCYSFLVDTVWLWRHAGRPGGAGVS